MVVLFSVMICIVDAKSIMGVLSATRKSIKSVQRNKCMLIIVFALTLTIASSLLELVYLKIFDGINEWNTGIASVPGIYDNGFHLNISIGEYFF